jgi:tRNA threonylcarbamoyladenosine biosynthesis protein TsaE
MAQRPAENCCRAEGSLDMSLQVMSRNSVDTEMLGEQVGRLLEAGDIVCLYGELGSGKTVLTKGMARGLGVTPERAVRSPSFVFMHRYQGRVPMYHADLYRLDGPTDIEDIGLREFLGGDGVAVIEWADKLGASLPAERLEITIAHQTAGTRMITITPQGARYHQLLEQWQSQSTARGEACGQGGHDVEMASA